MMHQSYIYHTTAFIEGICRYMYIYINKVTEKKNCVVLHTVYMKACDHQRESTAENDINSGIQCCGIIEPPRIIRFDQQLRFQPNGRAVSTRTFFHSRCSVDVTFGEIFFVAQFLADAFAAYQLASTVRKIGIFFRYLNKTCKIN